MADTVSPATTDFLSFLDSVPEDQRAPLVKQYLKDASERQRRNDEEHVARCVAELSVKLGADGVATEESNRQRLADLEQRRVDLVQRKAEVERMRANNDRMLAEFRRAANERIVTRSWCDTLVNIMTGERRR
jgi:hypothetical protein